MKHFKQMDMFRAIALILVLIYHFWVVAGYPNTGLQSMNTIIGLGGEIGVTLFFMLSGFGIYCSLNRQVERNGKVYLGKFLKQRFRRIAPQYYCCLCVLLLVADGAVYISRENLKSVITHFLFIHNLFPDTNGSINGVLWTMGVIVQFYIFSLIFYKIVEKLGIGSYVISVVLVIGSKALIFSQLLTETESGYYFIYGRQLLTALDCFILGMLLAKYALYLQEKRRWKIELILSLTVLMLWCLFSQKFGTVYSNTWFGYTWHSILTLLLGWVIINFLKIKTEGASVPAKILLFLAKYEYGIYLWHLVIANNLYEKSTIFHKVAGKNYWLWCIVMSAIAISVGYISTSCLERKEK